MDLNPWQAEREPVARPPPPYPIDPLENVHAPPPPSTQSHEDIPQKAYETSSSNYSQEVVDEEPRGLHHDPLISHQPPAEEYLDHENIPYAPYHPSLGEPSQGNPPTEAETSSQAVPLHPATGTTTQSLEIPPPPNPPVSAGLADRAPPYSTVQSATLEPQGTTDLPSKELNTAPLNTLAPPLPPRRPSYGGENLDSPIHYTRDPHRLTAYLIPFPKPHIKDVDPSRVEDRFLIYTPPPPPLTAPKEGEKEAKFHKVQRKWEQEVRQAKTSDAKVTSWKGVKSKATKGIDWAMGSIKSSNLDFLNRVPTATSKSEAHGADLSDSKEDHIEGETTKKTVGLEEMVLVYPADVPGTEEEIRAEFVNTMLRTKSKAQKDAVIATGLFPVALAIDILAGPFGGLAEIDGVWAFASIRGAKTARSVTKRLTSTSGPTTALAEDEKPEKAEKPPKKNDSTSGPSLKLTFTPSPRLEVLRRYLAGECHRIDARLFPHYVTKPVETDVIAAIGWSPSQTAGETRNWEDEQWEVTEVKEDFKQVMHKGAKEWGKWCKGFERAPEKAGKK